MFLGHEGLAIYFFQMNPKNIEKELFMVVVYETHFTVSARRVHQLLAPNDKYEPWLQVAILKNNLEEGTDYWHRERNMITPTGAATALSSTFTPLKAMHRLRRYRCRASRQRAI